MNEITVQLVLCPMGEPKGGFPVLVEMPAVPQVGTSIILDDNLTASVESVSYDIRTRLTIVYATVWRDEGDAAQSARDKIEAAEKERKAKLSELAASHQFSTRPTAGDHPWFVMNRTHAKLPE